MPAHTELNAELAKIKTVMYKNRKDDIKTQIVDEKRSELIETKRTLEKDRSKLLKKEDKTPLIEDKLRNIDVYLKLLDTSITPDEQDTSSEEETELDDSSNDNIAGIDENKAIIDRLKQEHRECTAKCRTINEELRQYRSEHRFEFEIPIIAGKKGPYLIDLLEKLILTDDPNWKDNLISLIDIPNDLHGSRLKGGSYFEALFQLAFALELVPQFKNIKIYDKNKNAEFKNILYEQEIESSGGGAHSTADIFIKIETQSSKTEKQYICGDLDSLKEDISGNQYFSVTVKNFVKEKSIKTNYDIAEIHLEVFGDNMNMENHHIIACVRNKEDFKRRLKTSQSIPTKITIGEGYYGFDELLSWFDDYRHMIKGSNNSFKDISARELYPKKKAILQPLSLYFHQQLVSNKIIERITEENTNDTSLYTCIGVLPRGGKSFIAGSIMEDYNKFLVTKRPEKQGYKVLFISSAISETMSQFKHDLIEKYSNFADYKFIDVRDAAKEVPLKDSEKYFIFASRQLITGKDKDTEDKVDKELSEKEVLKLFKNLEDKLKTSPLEYDLVFFDEAHIGGITMETQKALSAYLANKPPVVMLTATYKKIASEYIRENRDLVIWDLEDIQVMKKLPERWSQEKQFDDWFHGEKESETKEYKKYSLIDRFGEETIRNLIENMVIDKSNYKSELRRIVKPYDNFPMPYIMYSTLNSRSYNALIKDNKNDENIGFDYSDMFKINNNFESLKTDDYKEWSKAFQSDSVENLKNLITFLTPVIRTGSEDFTAKDDKIPEDERILKRIFKVSKASQSRTSMSSPFSMIMFLPTIKHQNVGNLCKALGSLFLTIPFWRDKFVFLSLSEVPKAKKTKVEEQQMNSESDDEEQEQEQEGGFVEMLTMKGGSHYKDCAGKGICTWEWLNKGEMKEKIIDVEKAALREGKGLVILTGKRAQMGISLPCVDVVCMFDMENEADSIIQKMYRALTESKNKKFGFIVDLFPNRIARALFDYSVIKNLDAKTKSAKKSLNEIENDVFNGCFFNTDVWITKQNDADYMGQIKNEVLHNISKNYSSLLEKDIDKKILAALEKSGRLADFAKLIKEADIKSSDDKPEKKELEERQEVPEGHQTAQSEKKPKKAKEEEDPIEKARKLMPKYIKTFINSLFIKSGKGLNFKNDVEIGQLLDNALEDFDKSYESVKDNLDAVDCSCENKETNLYEQIYCEFNSSIKNGKYTKTMLKMLQNYIKHDRDVREKYQPYLENFMDDLRSSLKNTTPNRQAGGRRTLKRRRGSNEKALECGQFRVNYIFEEIHKRQVPDTIAKGERGEVFTPPELVRRLLFGLRKNSIQKGKDPEIWGLDKDGNFFEDPAERVGGLPDDVWRNPNAKFLDPANGIGNFPIVAFYKLNYELAKLDEFKDEVKRQNHIVENMLYMLELDPNNNRECERLFKCMAPKAKGINLLCGDSIEKDAKKENWLVIDKMKRAWGNSEWDGATFHVVMGNPPFSLPIEEGKRLGTGGRVMWDIFIELSLYILKPDGHLIFIHPQMWRKPLSELWNVLAKKNQLEFIEIHNSDDGLKYFKAGTRFDMYILKKAEAKYSTNIIDERGEYVFLPLFNKPFLSNYKIAEIYRLITNVENSIKVIYSRSKFGADKAWTSKEETSDFKYPVIRTLGANDKIEYIYANKDAFSKDINGPEDERHFGKSKVILSFNGFPYPFTDFDGKFGMCEIVFGIPIQTKKEGNDIVDAIETNEFREIIKATKWNTFQTEWRMFKYFKKDFYKQFLHKSKGGISSHTLKNKKQSNHNRRTVKSI